MYFNKKYNQTGSVFQKKYKRKLIEDENYIRETFLYINNNPVKHKICKSAENYKWSSIHEIINMPKDHFIQFKLFKQIFGNAENFRFELEKFSLADG